MTCPACGGADAEDGPGCVCSRRPAGHAPGVIPGVPVLTDAQANFLDFASNQEDNDLWAIARGGQARMAQTALDGLLRYTLATDLDSEEYRQGVAYRLSDLGRRALAAHRLGLATRASFTIDTGAS